MHGIQRAVQLCVARLMVKTANALAALEHAAQPAQSQVSSEISLSLYRSCDFAGSSLLVRARRMQPVSGCADWHRRSGCSMPWSIPAEVQIAAKVCGALQPTLRAPYRGPGEKRSA